MRVFVNDNARQITCKIYHRIQKLCLWRETNVYYGLVLLAYFRIVLFDSNNTTADKDTQYLTFVLRHKQNFWNLWIYILCIQPRPVDSLIFVIYSLTIRTLFESFAFEPSSAIAFKSLKSTSWRNFERSERSKVWKVGAFETVDF